MTTTIKRRMVNDPKLLLPNAIAAAEELYGENGYLLEYDRIAGEWRARQKVVKGDGGMTGYIARNGCDEDSVIFGGA